MNIRKPQMVLIAFAVAAWLGAVLELGAAAASDSDGDGVPRCFDADSNVQVVCSLP